MPNKPIFFIANVMMVISFSYQFKDSQLHHLPAKGIKVIIGSTPPANYIWWLDEEWNAANDVAQRVIDLNVMLKAYAEERGFGYADYHSVLKDEENGLKKEYQVDAVHPVAGALLDAPGHGAADQPQAHDAHVHACPPVSPPRRAGSKL